MSGLEFGERCVGAQSERGGFISERSRSGLCDDGSLGVQELLEGLNLRTRVPELEVRG